MANLASISRPYALAAFQYAQEKSTLPAWKAFLAAASAVAKHQAVVKMMANPISQQKDLLALFESVLSKVLNDPQKHFLHILAQNKRLAFLPHIANTFNQYCSALDKLSDARLVTAVPVDDAYKSNMVAALTKRLKQKVTLACAVDPAIIGGAIIHIGDHVIDGSIRGKLTRLLEFSLR